MSVYRGMTHGSIGAIAGSIAAETDSERLGALFDAHHQRLYRLARRLTGTPDEARDLVQDTFLRAARSPGAVPRGSPSEEAWLVRVLVNLCRDRWRRRKRERRYALGQIDDCSMPPRGGVDAALAAREIVWRALRELPPRRRAIVVLHEIEDVTVRQLASMLGVAEVTVRWHLSRGRAELAAIVKRLDP